MKRMLINATQQEELRMAMVDGQRLYDLNIEAPASERKKANIYLGKITRIEPSLEAAFVDYGAERHGFLPLKEVSSEYFSGDGKGGGRPNIKDVLKEGQSIVVQVDKEERGNKGAALTTFVSLAGRFIVLKPNKARSGGVSRRIVGQDRDAARKALNSIEVPDDMSVILRTAGIDRSAEELAWDLENLLTVWTAILNVVLERPAPFLIYRESDSVVRALRDYLTNDIGEILIDDEQTYKDACEHVATTMPHNSKRLKHYTDPVPLFTRFQIESQIESAFAHTVHLPSGGSIVIDHTEALVSIDINSARATKGGDIEATALNTNLEAAEEIARQLRIRDLGGLIVIDFIDMGPSKHQRDVENRLREAVRQDRARVQIGKISRFGLLEMSRQRLRPSIGESAHMTCPRCTGFGNIRSVESLALAILRIVGEEARKERTAKVIAQLPVEVSTYLLNEKRDWVQSLEDSNDTQIVLVANPLLETPHYEVRRVRDDQIELPENAGVSYTLTDSESEPETPQAILERKNIEVPAVGTLKPSTPAPKRAMPEEPEKPRGKGLFATILSLFTGGEDEKKEKPQQRRKKAAQPTRGRRGQQQKRRGDETRGQQQRKKTQKKQAKKPQQKKSTTRKKQTQKRQQPKQQKQESAAETTRDEAQAEATRSSRSRRSRGGRRRRRGGDRPAQGQEATQQASSDAQQKAAKPTPKDGPRDAPARSAEKAPKRDAKSAGDGAPSADKSSSAPRARTDAEPAPDASKTEGTAPRKAPRFDEASERAKESKPESKARPEPESKPKPESKPRSESKPKPAEKAASGNGPDAPAKPKLLPWEPQSLPVAAKPAPKPAEKTDDKPAPKPRPEPKPADSGQESG
ncbi:MAG: Rne/Rng family ribonuclease [Woeseiaceae bacterium]|nr:Rne/Rng family ribonuclease [Gammaproteobacteria bacterium]NNK24676.1 Rne/Rng family ribonuclease [Woeseiaceae bacterium]